MSRKKGDSWLPAKIAEDQQDEGHRLGPDEQRLPARARRRGVLYLSACRASVSMRAHARALLRPTMPCCRTERSISSATRMTAP